jgi:hypothetical protein
MTLYRVYCKFEADHINMPAGRRGQWRVLRSIKLWWPAPPIFRVMDQLGVISTKPYNRGSIIRPHKELNKVLAARRAEIACPKHDTGAGPCYCAGSIYHPHQ